MIDAVLNERGTITCECASVAVGGCGEVVQTLAQIFQQTSGAVASDRHNHTLRLVLDHMAVIGCHRLNVDEPQTLHPRG